MRQPGRAATTIAWVLIVAALGACESSAGSAGPKTLDAGADDASAGLPTPEAAPVSIEGARAGTRLVPLAWDAGEGAVALRGWHDRVLDVDCRFFPAADGRYRCLPVPEKAGVADARLIGAVFADAACSVPLLRWRACRPPPAYAWGAPRIMPTCSEVAAQPIASVGAAHAGSAVYGRAGGGCVPVSLHPGEVAYAVGGELPASTFVGADLVAQGSARLVSYALVAEDGASEAVGIWDTTRDAECAPGEVDSSLRCLPSETASYYAIGYADASCTTPAAMDTGDGRPCVFPTAVASSPGTGGSGFFESGAPVPKPFVSSGPGNCAPAAASERGYYIRGAPIPVEAFAPVQVRNDGTGRVVAVGAAAPLGQPLTVATTFRDTEHDAACRPTRFPDGYRCTVEGTAAAAGLYFRDAGCTQTVAISGPMKRRPTYGVQLHRPSDLCDEIESDAALAIGAQVTVSDPYVRNIYGQCGPALPLSPDVVFFELAGPIELPRVEAR